jgi:uncharacterized protein YjeT (DUF2065 family)
MFLLRRNKMSDAQIFQLIAILYTLVGLGVLTNTSFYKKLYDDFAESTFAMYIGGITALIIGFLLVTFHNTWTKDASVIITLLGWAALIKGVVIFICPKAMTALAKAMTKKEKMLKIMGIFIIIFGLFLAYLGFCPKGCTLCT